MDKHADFTHRTGNAFTETKEETQEKTCKENITRRTPRPQKGPYGASKLPSSDRQCSSQLLSLLGHFEETSGHQVWNLSF